MVKVLSFIHEELEHKLHSAVEFASNCAGPDGAKERIKVLVSDVVAELKKLAAEASPVVEKVAEGAVETAITAAKPTIEGAIGEPAASVVEAGLEQVAAVGEQIVENKVAEVFAPEPTETKE